MLPTHTKLSKWWNAAGESRATPPGVGAQYREHVDRRDIGSWLSGPRSVAEASGQTWGFPGQRLGLPETGVNSVAGFGRRLVATFVDWIVAMLIASAFTDTANDQGWATLAVFAVLNIATISTVGAGIGGRLLRIRVARMDGANPPVISVVLRTFLLCLVIPAMIWDRDNRGLHDRFSYSVVVSR